MSDLTSKNWIVAKGVMFAVIALFASAIVWLEAPSLRVAALLAVIAWSSARFYYFLFYVLERYVDPTMRYAGVLDLLMGMRERRRRLRAGESPPSGSPPPT